MSVLEDLADKFTKLGDSIQSNMADLNILTNEREELLREYIRLETKLKELDGEIKEKEENISKLKEFENSLKTTYQTILDSASNLLDTLNTQII